MLSRLAREFAAEIALQDWSDAPWRIDRAGHDRTVDTNRGPDQLTPEETDRIRLNVTWVVAQVLGHADPNLNVVEFAEAAGVTRSTPGILKAGLRAWNGRYARPGTYDYDELPTGPLTVVAEPSLSPRAGSVGITLDIERSPLTWGDLREFVALGARRADTDEIHLDWDAEFGDSRLTGLSSHT